MTARLTCLWLSLLGMACAGQGAMGSQRSAAGASENAALRLAARLPAGADRCVLARPARAPEAARPLLARLSQADPLPWVVGVTVEVYASASHTGRDGKTSERMWLALVEEGDRARDRLDATSPLELRWGKEPWDCDAHTCPAAQASWVAPGVLRIQRGPWPSADEPGMERHCRHLAKAHPDALEVAARRGKTLFPGQTPGHPLRSLTWMHASGAQIERIQRDIWADAATAEARHPDLLESLGLPVGVPGAEVDRQQDGARVETRVRVRWDDLAMAVEDGRRIRLAQAYARNLEAMRPVEAVDTTLLEPLLQQIRIRLDLMRQATHEQRERLEMQAERLLDRGARRHPKQQERFAPLRERLDEVRAERSDTGDTDR